MAQVTVFEMHVLGASLEVVYDDVALTLRAIVSNPTGRSIRFKLARGAQQTGFISIAAGGSRDAVFAVATTLPTRIIDASKGGGARIAFDGSCTMGSD